MRLFSKQLQYAAIAMMKSCLSAATTSTTMRFADVMAAKAISIWPATAHYLIYE